MPHIFTNSKACNSKDNNSSVGHIISGRSN